MKYCVLFLAIFLMQGFSSGAVFAFDDDSTIDLRFFDKRRCQNGKNLNEDSGRSRFACDFTEAFVDSRNYLYKNDKRVDNNKVLDFKLSRGGKIFYRRQIDSKQIDRNKKLLVSAKLYNEKGLLYSGAGGVVLYLISYGGDVVYLNENGEILKNGKMLNAGASSVPILKNRGRRISPKVALDGAAVYINGRGDLYKDGVRLNSASVTVTAFKIDQKANVFYTDTKKRLYKNRRKIYNGPHPVVNYILKDGGGVGILVDHSKGNLIFKGRKFSAGASRVVSFRFNRSGDLIYRDERGRRWNNGRQTGN